MWTGYITRNHLSKCYLALKRLLRFDLSNTNLFFFFLSKKDSTQRGSASSVSYARLYIHKPLKRRGPRISNVDMKFHSTNWPTEREREEEKNMYTFIFYILYEQEKRVKRLETPSSTLSINSSVTTVGMDLQASAFMNDSIQDLRLPTCGMVSSFTISRRVPY